MKIKNDSYDFLQGERSYFLSDSAYQRWVKSEGLLGRAEGSQEALFSVSKTDADKVLEESGGSKTKLANALGLRPDTFVDGPIHRVDIKFSDEHGLRLATGYEPGANCFYNTTYSDENKPDIVFLRESSGLGEIVLLTGEVLPVDYSYFKGLGVVRIDGLVYEVIDEKATLADDLVRLNGRYVTTGGLVHQPETLGYKGVTSGGIQEAVTNCIANVSMEISHYTLFGGYSNGEKEKPFEIKENYTALYDAVGSYQDLIRAIDREIWDPTLKCKAINIVMNSAWDNILNDRAWEEKHTLSVDRLIEDAVERSNSNVSGCANKEDFVL